MLTIQQEKEFIGFVDNFVLETCLCNLLLGLFSFIALINSLVNSCVSLWFVKSALASKLNHFKSPAQQPAGKMQHVISINCKVSFMPY